MAGFLSDDDKARLTSLSVLGYKFHLSQTQFIDVFRHEDTGDIVVMKRVRPINGQYRSGNQAFTCLDANRMVPAK